VTIGFLKTWLVVRQKTHSLPTSAFRGRNPTVSSPESA
jgi:hypothetical protein